MTLQQKFYRMHKDNEIGYERWWHSFTGHDPQTGEEKSFFIEFYLCNPALGSEKPILGQHPAARREKLKPSYLMVKVGTWGADAVQVHKFYGWKRIHVDRDIPFSIQAGDCYLTEDATRGIVRVSDEEASRHPEWMCKGGAMSWSLLVDKKTATQAGSRREGTRAEFRGEVLWNGRKFVVSPKNCNGYAGAGQGRDFPNPWIRLFSANLRSEKSGKRLRDKAFEFDAAGQQPFCRTTVACRETKTHVYWHVEEHTLFHRRVADISCRKNTMLLLNYESPEGTRRHRRLWCGGSGSGKVQCYRLGKLVESLVATNVGCEYGEYKLNLQPNKGGTIRRGRKAEESPDRKGRSAAESAGRGNLAKAVTEKNRRK